MTKDEFIIITKVEHQKYEAWLYRGPLDLEEATPVVWDQGSTPESALKRLLEYKMSPGEGKEPKDATGSLGRRRSKTKRKGNLTNASEGHDRSETPSCTL